VPVQGLRVLILVVLAVKPQCFFITGGDSCDVVEAQRRICPYSRDLDLHRVPSALIEAWVGCVQARLRSAIIYRWWSGLSVGWNTKHERVVQVTPMAEILLAADLT